MYDNIQPIIFNQAIITWPDGTSISIPYTEIEINEGLKFQHQFGHIKVQDLFLLSKAIIGGERITIKFETRFDDGEFIKQYVIYSKSPETIYVQGQRFYKLLFVSPEAMASTNLSISKKYKMSPPEIVADIFRNQLRLEESRVIETDPKCNQIFDYCMPNIKLADALNFMQLMAVDSEGYPYCLYEDIEGYKFKSLSTLLGDYDSSVRFVFTQRTNVSSIVSTSDAERAFIIDKVQIFHRFNLLDILSRGALQGKISTYDPIKKRYLNIVNKLSDDIFDNRTSFKTFDDEIISRYTETEDNSDQFYFPTTDNSYYEYFLSRANKKRSIENLLSSINVQFAQHNSTYFHRTGDCINLSFDHFIPDSTSGNVISNEAMSGKYLVTSIKHTFTNGETIVYDAIIETAKLGYGEEI